MSQNILLLVDDDPNDEELARLALSAIPIPHTLEVTRDGPQTLEWFFGKGDLPGRGFRELPRLVLLDLKLPKMTGLEVLQRLRADERTRWVPVVVFTSSLEERDLVESYRLGVNGYVRKPVDFSQYRRLVVDLAKFWLEHNQPALRPFLEGART